MIDKKILENIVDESTYTNVVWEYDKDLIQIIKHQKKDNNKEIYNLKFNNLKNKFDVMAVLDNGKFKGYCNCEKGKKGQNCEHLIWAGIRINEEDSKQQTISKNEKTKEFKISIFEKIASFSNVYDELILHIELVNLEENNYDFVLRVGLTQDNLYVIPNIRKFLLAVKNNEELNYGKKLKTKNYIITALSENLFNTIDYLYLMKKADNKKFDLASLDEVGANKIFKSLINQYILYKKEEYYVMDRINDINLKVEENEEKLKIIYSELNNYNYLNTYLIINNLSKTFYILNDNDINKLKLIELFQKKTQEDIEMNFENKREIILSKEQNEKFLKDTLPKIYNDFNFVFDPKMNIEIIDEKLEITLFCYSKNRNIYIKPQFKYGDYLVEDSDKQKIIKRNKNLENHLFMKLISQGYDFDAVTQEFYISIDRSQFLFLTKNIFDLKEEYNIELDEKLKKSILNINSNTINIKVNKSKKYDYFNVDIDTKELPIDEINKLIESYENKKTFHKLSSDLFVKLDDKKVYEQLVFIRDLIGQSDYKLNTFRVPKYKAIILEEEIKNKFNTTKFNQEFLNYVESIKLVDKIDNEEFDKQIHKLRGYQKKGVEWINNLYQAQLGGLLADEMGLGKTIQTISFLNIAKIDNALIVVPKGLLYNWYQEFLKFDPDKNVVLVTGDSKQREKIIKDHYKTSIILTSYSSLVQDYLVYENMYFSIVVIDEAQYIKNPTTKKAIVIKKIKGKFFLALTGTPIENNLLELWSIFDFILPDYLQNLKKFKSKYKIDKSIQNLDVLKKSIAPFVHRRLKTEVLKELPNKIETTIYCEMEENQKQIYKTFQEKYKEKIENLRTNGNLQKNTLEILSYITRLRQLSIEPSLFVKEYDAVSGKMETFLELIHQMVSENKKILVFSQYTELLKKIGKKLTEHEYKYYYLDGNTKPKQRLIDTERFNKNKIPVYLISLKAGGVGLNLTGASDVIIYDPWWNPSIEEQAIDRTHRIGQKNTVQVMRLIAKDTIEEVILQLKEDKKDMINKVLDNENKQINKMKTNEIIDILFNE